MAMNLFFFRFHLSWTLTILGFRLEIISSSCFFVRFEISVELTDLVIRWRTGIGSCVVNKQFILFKHRNWLGFVFLAYHVNQNLSLILSNWGCPDPLHHFRNYATSIVDYFLSYLAAIWPASFAFGLYTWRRGLVYDRKGWVEISFLNSLL